MRRVLLTTIGLAFAATAAVAADLPRGLPAKAPAVYLPPAYNWTGFYLGFNGGAGWGTSRWSALDTRASTSGGLFGGTAGYNWQAVGSPWVFGLEGDIDWSNIEGSSFSAACPPGCRTRNDWLGTARGRVGYAWNSVMPYVTGGLAVGDVKADQFAASVGETKAGWTVGGGLEAALGGRWTAKAEYLHVDLGSVNCTVCVLPSRAGFYADIVRGGFNYRF